MASDDLAEEAYRVVRDALRQSRKVGLGQITLRGKEHLAAVKPCGDGLLMETLHYADEIREGEEMFQGIEDDPADADLLEVATSLIERKTAPFDASAYTDRYAVALAELLEGKRRSRKTRRVSAEDDGARDDGNVVDLMAALKQSLKNADGKPKPRRTGSKKAS